jgi:pimeloyl-ACP methyl ester carboxylesterase
MVLPAEVVAPVRIDVGAGHHLAVRRRGHGGVPLLLVHGFPCTSRIWSHNVVPLAAAGFDVVAPDLRGYGESDFAPDGFYDLNAFDNDLIGLFDRLGWDRAVVAGHDLGAMIAIDLANRHPGRVDRLVILDDSMPDQRRRYVAEFYGHRMWCPPDAFDDEDLAFLTEPYGAASRLRAAFADYEIVSGRRALSAPEMLDRPVEQRTLLLVGSDQVTIGDHVDERATVALPQAVGPFWIKGAGHFLPWERPTIVNRAIAAFCGDLV